MARAGVDRETGKLLTGWAHCAQSISVILSTRVGWRVMRRSFGARVADLQDRNPDPATLLAIFAAVAEALRRFEPGFRLTQIAVIRIAADGSAAFDIRGNYYPRGHVGDYSVAEERGAVIGGSSTGFRVEGVT